MATEYRLPYTAQEFEEKLAKIKDTDQTYDFNSENAQSGKAVAEALSAKANAIIVPYQGRLFYLVDRNTSIKDAKMSSFTLYGKSTQASGTPTPTNMLEIASTENPTISVATNEDMMLPTVYTFNGVTLRSVGTTYDKLVMENGRIKLVQNVFYKKDFSDVEFTKLSTIGFTINTAKFGIKNGSGLCNMLKYSTSGKDTFFMTNSNILYAMQITEMISGMSLEDWKATYAKDMEVLLPLKTPIVTDVTEQFLDNLNITIYSTYCAVQFDTNLSSASFSYIEDTKAYIDQKFNELATALVANA